MNIGNRVTLPRMPFARDFMSYEGYTLPILVLGAGGIGARVLPTLVKMLSGGRFHVYVMDDDIVEPSNLLRQPFSDYDLGKPKALVMQERYDSEACPVTAVLDRLTDKLTECPACFHTTGSPFILLGCVDNAQARWNLLSIAYRENTNRIPEVAYFDAGNDGTRGQVIIGHMRMRNPRGNYRWVTGVDLFPEVWDPEPAPPEPCNRIDTQTPVANQMAATLLLAQLYNCLRGTLLGTVGHTFDITGGVDPLALKHAEGTQFHNGTGSGAYSNNRLIQQAIIEESIRRRLSVPVIPAVGIPDASSIITEGVNIAIESVG